MRLAFEATACGDVAEEYGVDLEALSGVLGEFAAERGLGAYEKISVSLSFMGEREIGELNERYRDIAEPTDVLSFPLWEEEGVFIAPEGWEELPLGDVVVSPSCVRKNAENQKVDYNYEIALVIIHGVLHLIGYDHDTEDRKSEMWREQEVLVKKYFKKVQGGLMSA